MFVNRRAGGRSLFDGGKGVKILMGVLGVLMVGGIIGGVAVPLAVSAKNAQDSTPATTIGKISYFL